MINGLIIIYSSSSHMEVNYGTRQLFWIIGSLFIFLILIMLSYRFLVSFSLYFYLFFVLLLAGNLIFGKEIAGTKSWIRLSFIQIQPSEFMKIIVILFLAFVFSKYKTQFIGTTKLAVAALIVLIPFLLVALQPDLGTALSFLFILAGVFVLGGIKKNIIIIILVSVIGLGVLTWNVGLKDYQKKRLATVIFPHKDPHGTGYQSIQSKIAIGSGGFLGKGMGQGSQNKLKFLPARHTDFIFSVLGEEFGYLGVLYVLMCYFFLLTRIFKSIDQTIDREGSYTIFLIGLLLSSQFFINVLMTIGFFPVTGIPLPFYSYGGSSILANTIAISMIINIKMRRFVNV